MSFGRATKYVIRSVVENMSVCRASKTCHLAGSRIMSWGPASKYVIWSGIEISHLVGHLNMSFGRSRNMSIASIYIIFGYMSYGRATKYVILSGDDRNVSFGRASKYVIWSGVENVIWSGVEIYHLVICHLVGRRNLSFGRASKYVIWSGVELCHLVGRRNMSFGRVSKYVIWSGVKICHLVKIVRGGGIITLQSKTNCFDWGFISKL